MLEMSDLHLISMAPMTALRQARARFILEKKKRNEEEIRV